MKIAIPVKMNKDNPALASLFGKAKWFAIVRDGDVSIEANPADGGRAVVEWLAQSGVDAIIMQEMGMHPYRTVHSYGNLKPYYEGFDRILLEDVNKSVKCAIKSVMTLP
jgi:predicted Fe-Mo cluster-binding NifX family protein